MNATADPTNESSPEVAAEAIATSEWFIELAKQSFGENLVSATVYGPAVTPIFDLREHLIHVLLVLSSREIDQLLDLAKHSKQAARRRVSPPLVMIEHAIAQSKDVFPLEWLDISQFHRTLYGKPLGPELSLDPKLLRLQCERDLRSIDIHLLQGILASGGKPARISRLEDDSADSLVRVLRGISWLSGDRAGLLPTELIERCEQITSIKLPGCAEAIKAGGRHDVHVVKDMLSEIAELSNWIDAQDIGTP